MAECRCEICGKVTFLEGDDFIYGKIEPLNLYSDWERDCDIDLENQKFAHAKCKENKNG